MTGTVKFECSVMDNAGRNNPSNSKLKINQIDMKNLLILPMIVFVVSCKSDNNETKDFIRNFFDTNFKFVCSDSTKGKVELKLLYNQIDTESMSFKFVIPDTIQHADFYNAYTGRLTGVYFVYLNEGGKKVIDSLLYSPDCKIEPVKKRIQEYFCNEPVFFNVFKTALESFYSKSENKDNLKLSPIHKPGIPIDTLIKIALLQFDILHYDTIRGFIYHFVCGVNPYSYSIQNKVKLLIPGFCQEALRNKLMWDVHSRIMHELGKQAKMDYPKEKGNIKGLCLKYQDELRKRLVEDGTLKKLLLNYYEKNKDIEPFILVDNEK